MSYTAGFAAYSWALKKNHCGLKLGCSFLRHKSHNYGQYALTIRTICDSATCQYNGTSLIAHGPKIFGLIRKVAGIQL